MSISSLRYVKKRTMRMWVFFQMGRIKEGVVFEEGVRLGATEDRRAF